MSNKAIFYQWHEDPLYQPWSLGGSYTGILFSAARSEYLRDIVSRDLLRSLDNQMLNIDCFVSDRDRDS